MTESFCSSYGSVNYTPESRKCDIILFEKLRCTCMHSSIEWLMLFKLYERIHKLYLW